MTLELKMAAAAKALDYIEDNMIIGIGSGSTVNCFIEHLARIKHRIDAVVAASSQTERLLKQHQIPVIDLNAAEDVPIYIDGADEVNADKHMIKGGGGALAREKIIANVAKQFICIVDGQKWVEQLGHFPVALEVMPMARSFVAREVVKLGGEPHYREGFLTDNGNIILDVYAFDSPCSVALENTLNQIPGVVENGLFMRRAADVVIVAQPSDIVIF